MRLREVVDQVMSPNLIVALHGFKVQVHCDNLKHIAMNWNMGAPYFVVKLIVTIMFSPMLQYCLQCDGIRSTEAFAH